MKEKKPIDRLFDRQLCGNFVWRDVAAKSCCRLSLPRCRRARQPPPAGTELQRPGSEGV